MRTRYEVVPATEGHIQTVADNVREADRQEIWASSHRQPLESIMSSAEASREVYAGLADGEAMCIFGFCAATFTSDIACPWMIGAKGLEKHAKAFMKMSRPFIDRMNQRHKYLRNFVDARNEKAIKWLKVMGFRMFDPVPFGAAGLPFHPFERVQEKSNV